MDKTIDDLFILKLIKAGDRLAFKHLFELYFTPLCRFVHLYMKKPGAAEDIVVDIFASFWERRETLQIQITLKAYLFQSARNRALNYLRDNGRLSQRTIFPLWNVSRMTRHWKLKSCNA